MSGSPALAEGATFDVAQLSTPAQALATYFAAVTVAVPAIEHVPLADATGRILAIDALADADHPADPRSTMDGFAVVGGILATSGARRIVGEVRMGQAPPGSIDTRETMRIPTGGVLPDGADAVVPIEDTVEEVAPGGYGPVIIFREDVAPGENVTPPGSDMRAGDRILAAGRRIGGPELAVLATIGIVDVPVFRRPRIAIVSTGDELIDPAATPGRGQIRDSNRWALAGSLIALGAVPIQQPVAIDTAEALTAAIRAALACADAVILTGGSSVGVRDLTPRVIDALGKPGVIVHGLRVKPGKPTVFAMLDGKPVIGLPGNPASSLMILEAVAAPIVSRLAGEAVVPGDVIPATAAAPFTARPGWTWFVPADVTRDGDRLVATPIVLRSANTSLLARASGYVVVGPDRSAIAAGEPVSVRRFSGGGKPIPAA
jgi:molybdopterin molybdotransferase